MCAAGRVVSAVMMKASSDATYAYSRHLLWGLAEITTAELVFCVPAIPLMLRHPNVLHRIRAFVQSRMPTRQSRENISPLHSQHDAQPEVSGREDPMYKYPWTDGNRDVNLAEFQLGRSRESHTSNHLEVRPKKYQGGILRTTEIDITHDY